MTNNYKTCLNTLSQSGKRALRSLVHKNRVIDLSDNTFTTLYNSCVLPVITYSSSVLDSKHISKIQTVHNKAMRSFLCTAGDIGRIELSVVIKIKVLRFWTKLIDLSNERLTKNFFLKDILV